MVESFWTIAGASVRGRGHEQTGLPCQDSSNVTLSPNGKWVILVASDGAGTAKRSIVGSRLVCHEFAKYLLILAEQCENRPPDAWVSDSVIQAVLDVRNLLREQSGSDDIRDYHCTLLAALIGPVGGISIHLGDGAIFGGKAGPDTSTTIDLSRDYFVSGPENGEYANETVFITERDWIKHLRIRPISAADWVILGTDGGMALAMNGETQPKSGFVIPMLHAVMRGTDYKTRCKTLEEILSDRQADKLTNDDKTLVFAIRSRFTGVAGDFSFTQGEGVRNQQSSISSTEDIHRNLEDSEIQKKQLPLIHMDRNRKTTIKARSIIALGCTFLVVIICAFSFGIWIFGSDLNMKNQRALPPTNIENPPSLENRTRAREPATKGNGESAAEAASSAKSKDIDESRDVPKSTR